MVATKKTIEDLTSKLNLLREWLENDAQCPCCSKFDVCLKGCTFEQDCPNEYDKMQEVRKLLNKTK